MKNYFFLLLALMLIVSCSEDSELPIRENDIQLRNNADLGTILTDTNGRTLYFFSIDHTGESLLCVDECIEAWPVFYAENPTIDEGLDTSDFGTFARTDGTLQTTYKGWPLYLFANDTEAGQTNGEGVNDLWFVAKPDYQVMIVQAQLIGRDVQGNETLLTAGYEQGQEFTFYITDDRGNTLYSFINDTNGVNNYTNPDFSNNDLWPIFDASVINVPSLLNASDFSNINVHGRSQLTYKGRPLYLFQQDERRGDNFGVGFPQPGIWPIVNQFTTQAP